MDLTYQTQLRETNELNWERFKSTLRAEVATLRGELHAGLAELRAEFTAGLANLRAELKATSEEQRSEVAKLRIEMGQMRAELLKWMFIYWCGSVIVSGALIVGMLKLGLR